MTEARGVEGVETDIALALRAQLLVNHSEAILFARLLELTVHLRAMTTRFLDAILNSPLQVKDRQTESEAGDATNGGYQQNGVSEVVAHSFIAQGEQPNNGRETKRL